MSRIVAAAAIRGSRVIYNQAQEFYDKALAEKSADTRVEFPETAYFLRQSLVIAGENPGAAWLIRQVLPSFPDQYQTSLREALKQARGRSI